MSKPAVPSSKLPSPSLCMPTATGGVMLVADGPVPTLAAGLAEVIAYAVAHSDSATVAARALGLSGPRELHRLARRYQLRLPWSFRKGGCQ